MVLARSYPLNRLESMSGLIVVMAWSNWPCCSKTKAEWSCSCGFACAKTGEPANNSASRYFKRCFMETEWAGGDAGIQMKSGNQGEFAGKWLVSAGRLRTFDPSDQSCIQHLSGKLME